MKLMIVAALLVASVAGQSLDLLKLNRESSLLKYDGPNVGGNDLLWRRKFLLGHPLEREILYGDRIEVPSYLQDEIVDAPVYQLDVLLGHPLFRVYYGLPLFRQYWQYPSFQRYVASIYFQRYWKTPAFQQYFINPVLFYKYIYPIVNLFKHDTTTYNYNYNTVDDLTWNKDDLVVPYAYNTYNHNQVYAKSLLDKLYGHLNINTIGHQGRLHEILTDVKLTPEGHIKEQTYGKIVDPVTGDVRLTVGDAKLVSEDIIPVDSTIFPEQHIYNYNVHHQYPYRRTPIYTPLVGRLLHGYGYNYGRQY